MPQSMCSHIERIQAKAGVSCTSHHRFLTERPFSIMGCSINVSEQDEVVEHDLDAGMTLSRRGILRALVATLKVVRAVPCSVYVTAGSCPRWPMSCTRFRSFMVVPPFAPRVKKESSNAFRKEPRGNTFSR